MIITINSAEIIQAAQGCESLAIEVPTAVPVEEYQRVCAELAEARKPWWKRLWGKVRG